MQKPTPILSTVVHRGRIIEVSTERLHYGLGREFDLDFVKHPGAAAVVAVDDSERSLFGTSVPAWYRRFSVGDPGRQTRRRRGAANLCGAGAGRRDRRDPRYAGPRSGSFSRPGHIHRDYSSLPRARFGCRGPRRPMRTRNSKFNGCRSRQAVEMVLRGELNDGKTAMALCRAQYHRTTVTVCQVSNRSG